MWRKVQGQPCPTHAVELGVRVRRTGVSGHPLVGPTLPHLRESHLAPQEHVAHRFCANGQPNADKNEFADAGKTEPIGHDSQKSIGCNAGDN
jgi:hypothetical protein